MMAMKEQQEQQRPPTIQPNVKHTPHAQQAGRPAQNPVPPTPQLSAHRPSPPGNVPQPSNTPQPVNTNPPSQPIGKRGGLLSQASAAPMQPVQEPAPPPRQAPPAPQSQGANLVQRYNTEQRGSHPNTPSQDPTQYPVVPTPSRQIPPTPQLPQSQQAIRTSTPPPSQPGQGQPAVRTSTPPPPSQPGQPVVQAAQRPGLWDEPSLDMFMDPGLAATSQAAEQWRDSWRSRQKAEAGPAIGITRGQASVPEPLMAMQHSIARMRAVLKATTQNTNKRAQGPAFWLLLVLLLCLTGGLFAYTGSTYLTHADGPQNATTQGRAMPALTITGVKTNTFTPGQQINVHGDHFASNSSVQLALSGIDDNKTLTSVQSNEKGSITASITLPQDALAGTYSLQATSAGSNQTTYLPIQILPNDTTTTNTPLQISNSLPVSFTLTPLATDPVKNFKDLMVSNSGDSTLTWTISTITQFTTTGNKLDAATSNAGSWLTVNDNYTTGQLPPNGSAPIRINVSTSGLQSSTKPYLGYVIITTTDNQKKVGQLIVPIQLKVAETTPEVIITPSPMELTRNGDGTCQPATLTVINLSGKIVNVSANPDDPNTIQLTKNQAQLQPAGQPGDTVVFQVSCRGIQTGVYRYHIQVYYDQYHEQVDVSV